MKSAMSPQHHAFLRAEQEKKAALIAQAARVIQSQQKGAEVEVEFGFDDSRVLAPAGAGGRPYRHQTSRRGPATTPFGASRFLNSLARSSDFPRLADRPEDRRKAGIFSPPIPRRRSASPPLCRRRGRSARRGWARPRGAPYLAAIDGMAFGDDPIDGAIRGRKFIHPRLGFSFEAPEGFVAGKLGPGGAGRRGRRRGSPAARQRARAGRASSLTEYLTSGWIDGLLDSRPVQPGSQWPAGGVRRRPRRRMEFPRRGGRLPRRPLSHHFRDQGHDAGGRRAIRRVDQFFRPITPEEAKLAQPLHLRLADRRARRQRADAGRRKWS